VFISRKGTYFDTLVAIKQLLDVEGETYEQTMKYIKRELWALMELRHPNIVQVHPISIFRSFAPHTREI
jgi:hypothetical protein